ncbi:hypothetical protein [Noviherbaspirillum sp.]|uniref:hypothetical protein n=1 Tax=Noviherbaspirillum sp. TaxID=1926288 RepID=UPI002D358977|nr:hypothetical protein [Noviherbaspirillum sp.]HZW22444.1 hypothetical protein [Noviherbaspirillum sp.]
MRTDHTHLHLLAPVAKTLFRLVLLAAVPAMSAYAAGDLLVEAELDRPEVHVHAQAVYRLRFLHAVDVRDVQLAAPALRLADLRRIGEDRTFEAERDGRRYRVHERRYAVFPFASGTLELAGAYAMGRVPSNAARPDGWRAIRIDAPARTLTVLPVDIQADGAPWLPASALKLTEQWTTVENGVHRRTLRIEATGVEAAQLPELEVKVDGMGVLPGQPRLQNYFSGERNVAVREQTFVIMPADSGLFTVPPLQLRWWNVATGKAETSALPGRTLHVGEAASVPAASGTWLKRIAFGHLSAILLLACGGVLLALMRRRRKRTREG